MGTVQLPTYEAQIAPQPVQTPRKDPSAAINLANAQRGLLDTVLGGAIDIGSGILERARGDEYNSAVTKYKEWSTTKLREIEQNPINPRDVEAQQMTEAELASPNLTQYAKDREEFVEGLLAGTKFESVRKALKGYIDQAGIAEKDGLSRFDHQKNQEISYDNYTEDITLAMNDPNPISARNRARDVADVALASDIITPKMYDDHLDNAFKTIALNKAKKDAMLMGQAGLEWIKDPANVGYTSYDGKEHALSPEEHDAAIKEIEANLLKVASDQDTKFSQRFVEATTPEAIDRLKEDLVANPNMLGTQKHTWDLWLDDKKQRILADPPAGASAVDQLYTRLYEAFDGNKNPGIEVPIKDIDKNASGPEHQALLAKRKELMAQYNQGASSTREDIFYEAYRVANDPYMSEKAKNRWIDDHTKLGGGLSPEDGTKVRGWVKEYNDDPVRKQAMDSVEQAFRIAMSTETSYNDQMKIARELYNATTELDRMFRDPDTTDEQIRATVNRFLEGRVIEDIKKILSYRTGGAGFPVASAKAGTARELETARELGLFTQFPEKGAEFEATYKPLALEQERAELKRVGVEFLKQEPDASGNQIYTDAQGVEYRVTQTREVDAKGKATMVERVYKKEYRTVDGKQQYRWVPVVKK